MPDSASRAKPNPAHACAKELNRTVQLAPAAAPGELYPAPDHMSRLCSDLLALATDVRLETSAACVTLFGEERESTRPEALESVKGPLSLYSVLHLLRADLLGVHADLAQLNQSLSGPSGPSKRD